MASKSFGTEFALLLKPRWEWVKTRLGPSWVFGWRLFFVYLLLTELMHVAVIKPGQAFSLDEAFEDWGWMLLSRSIVFVTGWLTLRLRTKGKLVPVQNLVTLVAIVCVNLWLDLLYAPDEDGLFSFGVAPTFIYGALFAALGFCLVAPLMVEIENYRSGSLEAEKSREQLRLQVEEIKFKERLAEELRASQLETVVIPQVEKLRDLLRDSARGGAAAVDKIRLLIEEHVRPLSASGQIDRLRLGGPIQANQTAKLVNLFTEKKPVKGAIRPVAWIVMVSPIAFLGQYMVFQRFVAEYTTLALLLWIVALTAIKGLIGPKIKANGATRAVVAGLVAYLTWVPISYLVCYLVGDLSQFPVMCLTAIGASFVYIAFFTLIRDFEEGIQANLALVKEKNRELKFQVSRYNRNQWVAQRNWSYLLHGKIQASLSVALIKLSQEPKPSRKTLDQVNEILDGILETLKKPKLTEVNTYESLDTLRQLWLGVCGIRFVLPTSVEAALEHDANARFAIGEIATEAVTNAVKHANATLVSIECELLSPRLLSLRISNDGKKVSPDYHRSIGSKMLDDLTEAWSLTSIGDKTQLRADLQIAS